MNRLESHESDHSVVGAYSSMALQQPRNWLKESYALETSASALARFVCQIEPAEKTVHDSEQGRDDAAYSGKTGNWDDAIAMHPG